MLTSVAARTGVTGNLRRAGRDASSARGSGGRDPGSRPAGFVAATPAIRNVQPARSPRRRRTPNGCVCPNGKSGYVRQGRFPANAYVAGHPAILFDSQDPLRRNIRPSLKRCRVVLLPHALARRRAPGWIAAFSIEALSARQRGARTCIPASRQLDVHGAADPRRRR